MCLVLLLGSALVVGVVLGFVLSCCVGRHLFVLCVGCVLALVIGVGLPSGCSMVRVIIFGLVFGLGLVVGFVGLCLLLVVSLLLASSSFFFLAL